MLITLDPPCPPRPLAKTTQPALRVTVPSQECPADAPCCRLPWLSTALPPSRPSGCRVTSTACVHAPAGAPLTLPCRKPTARGTRVSAASPVSALLAVLAPAQGPASLAPTQPRPLSASPLSRASGSWRGPAAQWHPVRGPLSHQALHCAQGHCVPLSPWEPLCRGACLGPGAPPPALKEKGKVFLCGWPQDVTVGDSPLLGPLSCGHTAPLLCPLAPLLAPSQQARALESRGEAGPGEEGQPPLRPPCSPVCSRRRRHEVLSPWCSRLSGGVWRVSAAFGFWPERRCLFCAPSCGSSQAERLCRDQGRPCGSEGGSPGSSGGCHGAGARRCARVPAVPLHPGSAGC